MTPNSKLIQISKFISTLGPIGYLPVAPGTWGSAFAAVIWFFSFNDSPYIVKAGVILVVCIIGIYTAGQGEKKLGHDASPIVIDELCGQWIALAFITPRWFGVIVGFFLFRLFDIWKPFPAYQSQKLQAGWGIVVDDVIAGLYAGVILLALNLVLGGTS